MKRWTVGFMALVVLVGVGQTHAALYVGGDMGGADLSLANGDILSGTFTNLGTLTVPGGATVLAQQGTALSITADQIVIDGVLDGSGAGFSGGAHGHNGFPGSGPGAGEGGLYGNAVHASGGGGGGYGGVGGHSGQAVGSPPYALGGGIYGDATSYAVAMGSGGGGAGDHGGTHVGLGGGGGGGGGAISLFANQLFLNGEITASGADGEQGTLGTTGYSVSGGGGGAGGGILLSGNLFLDGLLSAPGGDGAHFLDAAFSYGYGQGGGGGGGGRIKLFGASLFGPSFVYDVSGGQLGLSDTVSVHPAEPGSAGTFYDNTTIIPEPSTFIIWSLLGAIGIGWWQRRRA